MGNNRATIFLKRICAGVVLAGILAFCGPQVSAQSHVVVNGSVFGGGNAATVSGKTKVLMQDNALVKTDVYGGGALASVGTSGSDSTTVTIEGGTVGDGTEGKGNVFGGGLGDNSHDPDVNGAITVNIGTSSQTTPTLVDGVENYNNVVITGSVFGCNNSAGTPKDNVTVNIYHTAHTALNAVSGSTYALSQVFGGGNKASYTPTATGKSIKVHVHNCDNTIDHLYGGGNAADAGTDGGTEVDVTTEIDGGRHNWIFGGGNGAGEGNPGANIYGDVTLTVHAGSYQHLFGGSNEKGTISGTTDVQLLGDGTCPGRTITELYGGNNLAPGTDASLTVSCNADEGKRWRITNIYGGSRNAELTGNVVLTIEGGTFTNVFGGNNAGDTIRGDVTLNLTGGTITRAFGGNNAGGNILGDITLNVTDAGNACPLNVDYIYGGGNEAAYTPANASTLHPEVNINHLRDGYKVNYDVFGGGLGATATVTANPVVTIGDGTNGHLATIGRDVYGGGSQGPVMGGTKVVVKGYSSTHTTVGRDVYGGGALATVSGNTQVDILGGTVTRSVYGGGLGQTSPTPIAANVGATRVNIGATNATVANQVVIGGNVYGANNVNGTPSGNSEVHVYSLKDPSPATWALTNVFGGGDQANYVPGNNMKTIVEVHNCFNKIQNVFGGGNAASVPETQVTINGGTIANVYGGGNGESTPAHVGYNSHAVTPTSPTDDYGTGNTSVTVKGGTVTSVYGGSNSKGTTRGTATVNIAKDGDCTMNITKVFGGGNVAPCTNTDVNISCTGTTPIDTVFGGANAAPVTGNITLDITGGKIGSAFGGNNASGTISGNVDVTVEWDGSCANDSLGYVYGGGKNAPYTGSPTVRINKGTVTHDVFGGGYGNSATVGGSIVYVGDLTIGHEDYVATVGGAVYGAGYAGAVTGNSPGTTYITIQQSHTVVDGVFGAGSNAGVSGNTTITMTGGRVNGGTIDDSDVTSGIYGGSNAAGTVGGDVTLNIYGGTVGISAESKANIHGGGYGSSTAVTGDVDVTLGNNSTGPTLYGNVYGGSALGPVNTNTGNHTNVTLAKGTVNGNVYGGGLGDGSHAALVKGNVAVAVTGGKVTGGVFGCNDQNGTPKGTVTVNISGSAADANAIANVYGGGNVAHYDPTTTTKGYPSVTVSGCSTKVGNVYGGGNAAAVPHTNVIINGGTIANVYGGGNGELNYAHVGYKNTDATPSGNSYGNGTSEVKIHGGIIGNVYGGNNSSGTVRGKVTITADTTGGDNCANEAVNYVYGGGYGADTRAAKHIEVNINGATVNNDVYGGSAYGQVNTSAADTTVVNILGGTVSGNVYGGGLGHPDHDTYGQVNGKVFVNIGATSGGVSPTYSGSATLGGMVFGGNNTNGSPQSDIKVNIYKTAHNGTDGYPNIDTVTALAAPDDELTSADIDLLGHADNTFAIEAVYGGGNKADYAPAGANTTTVTVFGCASNTIQYVYGGGRAADSKATKIVIEGGRIYQVFAGGDGHTLTNPAEEWNESTNPYLPANIIGDAYVTVKGGLIDAVFGGSNTSGVVQGTAHVTYVDSTCDLVVGETFGGGNQADGGTAEVIIPCGATGLTDVYGGAKNADIGTDAVNKDVTLTVYGGDMERIFGGNMSGGTIYGNVTVNVYGSNPGHIIDEIFGGSNEGGAITGTILVNIDSNRSDCPLKFNSVYGGGNLVNYEPADPSALSPTVNLICGTARKDVFGGGKGMQNLTPVFPYRKPKTAAEWEAAGHADYYTSDDDYNDSLALYNTYAAYIAQTNTAKVTANPVVNIGVTNQTRSGANPKVMVLGNIYGGGNAAPIDGNTKVDVRGNRTDIRGSVYGGGNAAIVTGNTNVIIGDRE